MNDPQDTYQLYKTPSIATIGAYVSVAVAIFFGAYVMSMRSHVTRRELQYQKELQEAHSRVDRLTLKLMHVSNELHDTHSTRLRAPGMPSSVSGRDTGSSPGAQPASAQKNTPSTANAGRTSSGQVRQAIEESERGVHDNALTQRLDVPATMPETDGITEMTAAKPTVQASGLSGTLPAQEQQEERVVGGKPLQSEADTPDAVLVAEIPEMPELESGRTLSPLTVESNGGTDVVIEKPRATEASPLDSNPETEAFLSEAEALEGEIIVFNPEKQLVMVNLGRNRGAEVGRRFTLWRDGAYLGDVRVQRVFANMSACEIITALDKDVRVGDVARSADASAAP